MTGKAIRPIDWKEINGIDVQIISCPRCYQPNEIRNDPLGGEYDVSVTGDVHPQFVCCNIKCSYASKITLIK